MSLLTLWIYYDYIMKLTYKLSFLLLIVPEQQTDPLPKKAVLRLPDPIPDPITEKPRKKTSRKMDKLAGKSLELKVNPVFERVGDYTKDAERRKIDLRLNVICFVSVLVGIAALELAWAERR